jgi:3-isopropylmalate/(R)-2-methylmalate dehydratase small subunit
MPMQPFTTLETPAIPLPLANVDTDQILPARFLNVSRADGYGAHLMRDLRFDASGASRGHVIDDPRYANAKIMIARRNFGSGSSREGAVYALADFGLRCVIAPSFGDIFASNAVKNGVLPARVSETDAEALLASLAVGEGGAVSVDLEDQTIRIGNLVVNFAIDAVWKRQLLQGWDDVDFTLAERPRIEEFRGRDAKSRPWATPEALDSHADLL